MSRVPTRGSERYLRVSKYVRSDRESARRGDISRQYKKVCASQAGQLRAQKARPPRRRRSSTTRWRRETQAAPRRTRLDFLLGRETVAQRARHVRNADDEHVKTLVRMYASVERAIKRIHGARYTTWAAAPPMPRSLAHSFTHKRVKKTEPPRASQQVNKRWYLARVTSSEPRVRAAETRRIGSPGTPSIPRTPRGAHPGLRKHSPSAVSTNRSNCAK